MSSNSSDEEWVDAWCEWFSRQPIPHRQLLEELWIVLDREWDPQPYALDKTCTFLSGLLFQRHDDDPGNPIRAWTLISIPLVPSSEQ